MSEKKRVGILTFQNTLNFGADLQCYALYRSLENSGCEVEVIDYRSPAIEKREMHSRVLRQRNAKNMIGLPFEMAFKTLKKRKFHKFEGAYLQYKPIAAGSPLVDQLSDFDVVVVGSDQVWNLGLTDNDYSFFLPGQCSAKKVSYAASFGNGKYSAEADGRIRRYLSDFAHIGIRESTGVRKAQELGFAYAEQVLDPTLLLSASQWNEICPRQQRGEGKYVLAYAVNMKDEVVAKAKKIADERHLPLMYVHGNDWTPLGKATNRYGVDPAEFVQYVRDAECVVTSSFHGTCFSLLFHRPFLSVLNNWSDNGNSRIESLLQLAGLGDEIGGNSVVDPDWRVVDANLDASRLTSLDFLMSSVS